MLRHAVVMPLRGLLSLLRLTLSPLRRFRHRERGPRLLALRGFASPHAVCFIGRVSEDMGLGGAERSADYRRRLRYRLRDAYRLLISRPVPEARVEIRYAGQHWETETDEDGLLFCRFDIERAPAEPIWQPYQARLLAPAAGEEHRIVRSLAVVVGAVALKLWSSSLSAVDIGPGPAFADTGKRNTAPDVEYRGGLAVSLMTQRRFRHPLLPTALALTLCSGVALAAEAGSAERAGWRLAMNRSR